jgi:hypothetical protein
MRRQWELRAMTSLYNCFTEGFDTAELKAAKTLLDELNAQLLMVRESLHRHDSTAHEMTSLLARRGGSLPGFASREICPFKAPTRKSYSPHPNWFAPSRRLQKNPMNCSIFNVAWLSQIPPHREDADIHACQIRFHPSHYSTR